MNELQKDNDFQQLGACQQQLFDLLGRRYNGDSILIKAKLLKLTGKDSFYDVPDAEAKKAFETLKNEIAARDSGYEPEVPEEFRPYLNELGVGEYKQIVGDIDYSKLDTKTRRQLFIKLEAALDGQP